MDVQKLIEEVKAMTVLELNELVKALEAEFGVSAAAPVAAAGIPMPDGMNNGEVDLIGVDEKTAAVIMAIVSNQTDIPLNRLSFKSIKLIEDKKGGEAK